jgi:hypothetical protein
VTTIYMTKGDLLPPIEATLKYLDGTTVDLSDASGVIFNMKKENGTVIVDAKAGSIVSAGAGVVKYAWAEGDTDVYGVCYGEFVVSFSGGSAGELTFPAKGDFEIRFRERLTD